MSLTVAAYIQGPCTLLYVDIHQTRLTDLPGIVLDHAGEKLDVPSVRAEKRGAVAKEGLGGAQGTVGLGVGEGQHEVRVVHRALVAVGKGRHLLQCK